MFSYHLRMATKSLRRNPVLSVLMIGAIGLGIGVSTTFVTAHYMLSMNPIPQKSEVLHYVELPMLYTHPGLPGRDMRTRAIRALEQVGLGNRLDHVPSQLSGGQQQRVAIARALVGEPKLILADEPTGNLDSHMAGEIMELLRAINDCGSTIVMVTHDPSVAARASREIQLLDGAVVEGGAAARSAMA